MPPKPSPLPRGFSLVEVLLASVLVLLVAGTSLALITQSMQAMDRTQKRAIANNLHRDVTSYLRAQSWNSLSSATATSLSSQLNSEFRDALSAFGSSSSIQVQTLSRSANARMLQVDLAIRYGSEVSSTSVRVTQRGISP
ncbi:hypothetical protein D3C72_1468520 [compost metagenome]